MILLSDIQFVIVLYKCALEESSTYISMTAAARAVNSNAIVDLFVYDNSPYLQTSSTTDLIWNCTYVSDTENGGLSVAYNEAANDAQRKGKKYVLLLDQDTTFPKETLQMYLEAINAQPHIHLFAPILRIQNGKIMSPCKYVNKWGKLIDSIGPGTHSLLDYVPVNSGLCIEIDAFFKAGLYNERIKVDGADFQFIERFKNKVGNQFYVLDLLIDQDFSLFETDFTSILSRFKIFLTDVRNFEKASWKDYYYYNRIALIRTLKLVLQTKKWSVVQYYMRFFLKNN